MLLSLLSAFLGILTYPPFGAYGLAFVFLVPYFWFLLKEKRFFPLVLGTLIFRLAMASFVASEALGDLLLFAHSAGLFLMAPIFIWALKKITPSEYIHIAALPVFFTLAEHMQARFTFLPFVKAYIGVNFAPSPFLGLARWGGALALSFFAVLINAILVAVFRRLNTGSGGRSRFLKFRFDSTGKALMGAAVMLVVFGFIFSRIGLSGRSNVYGSRDDEMRVALVSTARAFDEEIERFSDTLNREELVELSRRVEEKLLVVANVLEREEFDLVVFPEELFRNDYLGEEDDEAREKFDIINAGTLIRAYRALAKKLNRQVLAYFPTLTSQGARHNTGMLFAPSGMIAGAYHKRFLAYTGEYWPFADWQPFYFKFLQDAGSSLAIRSPVFDKRYQYERGAAAPPLVLENGTRFGTPLCSEAHYPFYMKQLVDDGSKFLMHPSSNNWVRLGFQKYLTSMVWYRQIEAVWLGVPILVNGREEYAGVVNPDGSAHLREVDKNEGFAVYVASVRL